MSEGKTPRRTLDQALAAWPSADRSTTDLDWDEAAEAVMARLGESPTRRVSDEALLSAPLPSSPNEVQSSAPTGGGEALMNTSSKGRERDRASLRELAKLAETAPASRPSSGFFGDGRGGRDEGRDSAPPQQSPAQAAEREENSGLIHLASLTASAPVAAVANEAPAMAPAPQDAPASTPATAKAPPAMGKAAGNPAKRKAAKATPNGAYGAAAEKVTPNGATGATAAPDRQRRGGWYFAAGVVAAAAVAAGLFVATRRPAGDAAAVAASVPAVPPAVAPPISAPAPAKPVVTPIAPADKGVDLSSLPEVAQGPVRGTPSGMTASGGGAAPKAVAPASPAPPPAAPAPAAAAMDPKLAAAVPTATASSDGKSLEALMQQAAGVTPSGPVAAAAPAPDSPQAVAPGSVPLKPSLGAIQGAIGAAMPGARACLGPDDPISRATVTFQSDGSVQSVSVTGGAAGKPAEACIRAALGKARVAPFAQPSFSAPATIRPN